MFIELLVVFILCFIGTGVLNILFRFFGKRGYMGNLYETVRGGTPRASACYGFMRFNRWYSGQKKDQ